MKLFSLITLVDKIYLISFFSAMSEICLFLTGNHTNSYIFHYSDISQFHITIWISTEFIVNILKVFHCNGSNQVPITLAWHWKLGNPPARPICPLIPVIPYIVLQYGALCILIAFKVSSFPLLKCVPQLLISYDTLILIFHLFILSDFNCNPTNSCLLILTAAIHYTVKVISFSRKFLFSQN